MLDSLRAGHALNPLEKRRQMVAAQLAISGSGEIDCKGVILLTWMDGHFVAFQGNPSRLARSRRPLHSSEAALGTRTVFLT